MGKSEHVDAELRNMMYCNDETAFYGHEYYGDPVPGNYLNHTDEVPIASRSLTNSLNSSTRDPYFANADEKVVPVKTPLVKKLPKIKLFGDRRFVRSEGASIVYEQRSGGVCAPTVVAPTVEAPTVENFPDSKDFSKFAASFSGNESKRKPSAFLSTTPVTGGDVPKSVIEEEGLLQTSAEEDGEIVAVHSNDDSSANAFATRGSAIPVITTPRKFRPILKEYDENANDVSSFRSALNNYRLGYM